MEEHCQGYIFLVDLVSSHFHCTKTVFCLQLSPFIHDCLAAIRAAQYQFVLSSTELANLAQTAF